jgi:hypothetical protein
LTQKLTGSRLVTESESKSPAARPSVSTRKGKDALEFTSEDEAKSALNALRSKNVNW